MDEIKPFLRWAGSKRKLVPTLSEYWSSEYSRYVEPFAGSASLFFHLQPKKALLNDINSELVETYTAIKTSPIKTHNQLRVISPDENTYYRIRAIDPSSLNHYQRAARFIYLNRYCFNGLYRTNRDGFFNVPYGKAKSGSLPTRKELCKISSLLKRKRIANLDFEILLREHVKEGDFVYLDPPYAVSNRRIFTQYGPASFGLEDIKRLKKSLLFLDRKGIPFVLSYAYCREGIDAFGTWNYKKLYTQRNISGFSSNRKRAAEIVVTNIEPRE